MIRGTPHARVPLRWMLLYAPPPVQQLPAARIKHVETLIMHEAGHSAYWEQPDIFNRTVLAFIQRVDHQGRSAS